MSTRSARPRVGAWQRGPRVLWQRAERMLGVSVAWPRDGLPVVLGVLLGLAVLYQYWGLPEGVPLATPGKGAAFAAWDWMLLSGLATLGIGVALADGARARLDRALDRLVDRGALPLDAHGRAALDKALDDRARSWARRGGLIVAVSIGAAFLQTFGERLLLDLPRLLLAVVEVLLAFAAGRYLGRLVGYGSLGWLLRARRLGLVARPAHPDSAAGLRPIGDYFLFQAGLAGLPAAFLATWLMLIPAWPTHRYDAWHEGYLVLLPVALVVEVLAFVVPMYAFHQEMCRQKEEHLRGVDTASREIAAMQGTLATSTDPQQRALLKDQLAFRAQEYRDAEAMPTWPVDLEAWRRFTFGNLALAAPLLSQVLGLGGIARVILDAAQHALEKAAT